VVNTVGPTGVKSSVVTFTPAVDLPPDATIRAYFSGFYDFAGNAVSSGPASFTTETGTQKTFSASETFSSTTQRNDTLSNAYWGTKVSGRLTGLIVGSTKNPSSSYTVTGTTTLSGSEYHWKNLVVQAGGVLKFSTTSAVKIYVSDSVVVEGTIDVSGADGEDNPPYYIYNRSPNTEERTLSGGLGGPNGGRGANVSMTPHSSGYSNSTTESRAKGTGGGGSGYTKTGTYRGYAGAGGSYGTLGKKGKGYSSSSYGSDGSVYSTYGGSNLGTSGMQGGSGGGAGSGGAYRYSGSTTYNYYRWHIGAGGGGGGGSILIEAKNDIVVRGEIDASGGRGGHGIYYGGSGGGGSGGDIWLRAGGRVIREGRLDASGGTGGHNRIYSSTSYSPYGGDGGGGRIMIEEPSNSRTSVNASGLLTSAKLSGYRSGGSLDFKPTSNTTLTTSSSNGGVFKYDEVIIPSGVTVTIAGDRAGQIVASDDITVYGAIRSIGGNGRNGQYNSQSGYTSVSRASAGAGGWQGGRSHTVNGRVLSPSDAEDGQGPGGGEGGHAFCGYKYTYTYSYTYYYYYYGGAGGGGGSASPGESGWRNWTYSYYRYVYLDTKSVPPYAGVPGEGGDAYSLYDSSGQLRGGSGGGGGANTMYYRKSSSSYGYYYHAGCGGGGGGAVLLETPGKLTVSGRIEVAGGRGGNGYSSSYGVGGGGGAGGAIVLRADSFSLTGTLDASGGQWGRNYTYTYYHVEYYGRGGTGSDGNVRLESKNDLAITNSNGGMATGTFYYKFLESADTGVTVWFDGGALNPDYGAMTVTQSASNVWLEVAHTKPDSDEVDESTATLLTPSQVAAGAADGYRFYRFRCQVTSSASYVDDVAVSGTYRTK
jgi:hypothetical protein